MLIIVCLDCGAEYTEREWRIIKRNSGFDGCPECGFDRLVEEHVDDEMLEHLLY